MDNQNLELTQREREVLMELFEENLLRDNYRDFYGKHKTRIYQKQTPGYQRCAICQKNQTRSCFTKTWWRKK